jgi:peptidyl-dipeptidase A
VAESELREFLTEHEHQVAPLERERNLAWWEHAISGTKQAEQRSAELSGRYRKLYSDPEVFRRLQQWRSGGQVQEPRLRRQLEVAYLSYLGNQLEPGEIEAMVKLEAEIESAYANYRGLIGGREHSDNEIRRILIESDDSELRRQAWEASKGIGPLVIGKVLELVAMRNRAARRLGGRDHFTFSLELQELDEGALFGLLERLELQTREPFAAAKRELDRRLGRRFGLSPDRLEAWHYSDPFFQEPPADPELDLERWFQSADVLALARATYDGLGLPTAAILARSDLYPRPGKNQHAFAIDIDRRGDVRILCNLENSERWTSTTLHELGHAVYDAGIDPDLPFLLRCYAHTLTTEAIALLMGRLSREADWLEVVLGLPADQALGHARAIFEHQRLGMLVFVRWALVMVHFERALYRQEPVDLGALWWSLVERFQGLRRPPGQRSADWAAKLHLALAPVYYQNYVLGELCASQILAALRAATGAGLVSNRSAGGFLSDRIFRPGALLRWDALVQAATGAPLGPDAFLQQYLR